ncbi:IclR family transcriptional regulator [Bradyrhizobium sp. NP1]|uniref:IclR family transcriptional regulator n=1 Tax=Bradyrhizobium sp. NP1 TaxID=3049772 RepID=UPI0025A548C4|nr:IclR family transcriptional regulator [Bradyrhizobium sp. NP1]WJR79236.1 IclR family transcriptional regulator [Bradyrhizobium sp. NP1]
MDSDNVYTPVSGSEVPGTQSLSRAAALLRVIATRNSVGFRLSELVAAVGLERPTVRRLLQGLMREGFVRQAVSTRRYFLGRTLFELGLAASPDFDIRGVCAPALERIAARTGDTAFLTIRSAFDSVCIDRFEGSYPVRALTVEIGARRPLGSTAGGLALLAQLSDQEVDAIVSANAQRLRRYGTLDVSRLRMMVRRTRTLGYALNRNDITEGVTGVGIALEGRPVLPDLAVSVVAISSRLDDNRQEEVAEIIRAETALIIKQPERSRS